MVLLLLIKLQLIFCNRNPKWSAPKSIGLLISWRRLASWVASRLAKAAWYWEMHWSRSDNFPWMASCTVLCLDCNWVCSEYLERDGRKNDSENLNLSHHIYTIKRSNNNCDKLNVILLKKTPWWSYLLTCAPGSGWDDLLWCRLPPGTPSPPAACPALSPLVWAAPAGLGTHLPPPPPAAALQSSHRGSWTSSPKWKK